MPIEMPSIGWTGAPRDTVEGPRLDPLSSASRAIEAELPGAELVGPAGDAGGPTGSGAPDAICGADRRISESLAAGALDAHGARTCLIEAALASTDGGRLAGPEFDELIAQLDELIADDPVLARLLA